MWCGEREKVDKEGSERRGWRRKDGDSKEREDDGGGGGVEWKDDNIDGGE